jgi:hypothetical protein
MISTFVKLTFFEDQKTYAKSIKTRENKENDDPLVGQKNNRQGRG